MTLELIKFPKLNEQKALQEAASEGLKSMQNLVNLLSNQPSHLHSDLTNETVSKFKNLISSINRTGHARFRRAPVPLPPPPPVQFQNPQPQNQTLTLDFTKPNILRYNPNSLNLESTKETFSVSSNSSFVSSAITGDGSVSNGKLGSSLFLTPAVSAGKPPLSSSSLKIRCHDHSDDVSGKRSGSNKCHCTKKRYTRTPASHHIIIP